MTNTTTNRTMDMKELQAEIRAFIDRRRWQQYHSPKNLAMALSVEAAELTEIFQWLTEEESRNLTPADHAHAEEEIGDIMIYLTTISMALGLDPLEAAGKKLDGLVKTPIYFVVGLDQRFAVPHVLPNR